VNQPFAGFRLPTSNTTYTPNQFFDVCLPHASRGTVRVVGYLIRKTLGWCDADGNPQHERHAVSYAEFVADAGISRAMIRGAIDEAIRRHFILCVEPPKSKKAGQAAATGKYELKWDERGEYVKDPALFRGFFAGEGNRTYVPNQFFDDLVPNESLAVLKVVGAVIRLSIGFANKWGHRRRHVALSYQHVQNYAKIHDRTTLSSALQYALDAHYVERVEAGFFDPDGGKRSKAAVYALKWRNDTTVGAIGMKSRPAETGVADRSENPTGIGSKSRPDDRFENPTGIEIKRVNKTNKQQPPPDSFAATFERLRGEGFDAAAARAIASRYPFERVDRQVRWLDRRRITSNRLGMLRAAIEQDWAPPGPRQGTGRGRGQPPRQQLGRPNWEDSHPERPAGTTSYAAALSRARERLLNPPNPPTTP
jgi:hypothetical protein